jgi:hypothetical protein
MTNVDIFGRPVEPLTHEEILQSVRATAAHDLITARAKHRVVVDKAVKELKQALEALELNEPWPEACKTFIGYAIKDLLASKPEPGAWTE